MNENELSVEQRALHTLCGTVRRLIQAGHFEEGERLVLEAMESYPSAAQPHNLFGILKEKEGDSASAMKHFRAAWALDPTFLPAQKNMADCGTLSPHRACAYEESDCPSQADEEYTVEYGAHHIGRLIRKQDACNDAFPM